MAQLHASTARAEDASATETAAARALAIDGLKLAQSNNCAEAVPKLERAEKLYHSAMVASRLGECYISLGRLVEGTETLRKVLREPPPSEPAPALLKALERAEKVLDAAKPRIAGLTLHVAPVAGMSLRVDGTLVPNTLVDAEIPIDPGEHTVNLAAPGFLKAASQFSIGEGEKKSLALSLDRDPDATIAPPPESPQQTREPNVAPEPTPPRRVASKVTPTAGAAPNHTAAYVALGVGAAGLATGGLLGFLTLQRYRSLQEQCPSNLCPPGQQTELSSAKRLGNLSTVAFSVGGAGVLLGSVLFFTGGSGRSDRGERATPSRRVGLIQPRLEIGFGHVRVDAEF